jgi:hypothetical protein
MELGAALPAGRGGLWHHRFTSRDEAFLVIAAWLEQYHTEPPHSGLGSRTPKEFVETSAPELYGNEGKHHRGRTAPMTRDTAAALAVAVCPRRPALRPSAPP